VDELTVEESNNFEKQVAEGCRTGFFTEAFKIANFELENVPGNAAVSHLGTEFKSSHLTHISSIKKKTIYIV